MSEVTRAPSVELRERLQVSSLTLLLLALVPCVLLLLLLHCLLLTYRLLLCAGARGRKRGFRGAPPAPEPVLAPRGTSSLTSSAERRAACATLPRAWRRSAPTLPPPPSSDSETERANLAPPNSPVLLVTPVGGSLPIIMHRRSSIELELLSLDKVHLEGELVSSIPQETSCFMASAGFSAAGPGLDSDFGASAGVSLRILSADSDGFPGATWASALEWDYYDPSYVTQNHIPKHRHHAPPITSKQYWV